MIDYLSNLVARQLGKVESVHPRLASRFEPPAAARLPGERRSLGDAEAPDALEPSNEFGFETLELIEPVLDVSPRPLSSPRRTTISASTERDDLQPTLPESSTRNSDTPSRASAVVEQPSAETRTVVEPINVQTVGHAPAENLPPPERIPETARPLSTAQQPPTPATPASNSDKVLDAPLPARSERQDDLQDGQDDSLMPIQAAPRIVSEQNVLPPLRRRRDGVRASPAIEPREDEQSAPPTMPTLPPAVHSRHADSPLQSSDATPPLRVNPVETPVTRPARTPEPVANVIAQPSVTRSMEAKVSTEAAMSEAAEAAPVINITIGRVEVRATHAPAAPRQQSRSAVPPMSLDDYLRRRAGGGSR
jgi:hypothetical protein